ncbi:MAG: hypothetical protein GY801_24945 [bacterium]|nr:hypothetical protein [bacterium]
MKVCVIGSGSMQFTRQMVKGMAESDLEIVNGAEVALVDIDERKCVEMARFCRLLNDECGGNLKITHTTDRLEALPGSDYVILVFATRNYHYRETGTRLAKDFGIHLVSGETTGPSSVSRIVRIVPELLELGADIEKLCPDAMVINYVNPTNVVGNVLARNTRLNVYAFCDGISEEKLAGRICQRIGLDRLDLAGLRIGGLNHFNWLYDINQNGRNLWQKFKDSFVVTEHQDRYKDEETAPLGVFEAWPLGDHPKEYMRYFQGKGGFPENDFITEKWDFTKRIKWYKDVWFKIDKCNRGEMKALDSMTDKTSEMICKIIESIEGDVGGMFPVNIVNDGRIPNLPDETSVELFGRFDKHGVSVEPTAPVPLGIRGMLHQVIDEQELAVEAGMTGNFKTFVRAIACDPNVMSLSDAESIAHNLLALEEVDFGELWDDYWKNVTPPIQR